MRNVARNLSLAGPTVGLLVLIGTVQLTSAYPGDVLVAGSPAKGPTPKSIEVPTGSYSVSPQTGAAQYTFPIPAPPARGGMSPSIALSYSSQNPVRGGIAVGWVLSGVPYIEVDTSQGRLGGTFYRSTLAGGQRLVPVNESGPAGMTQAFRAESDGDFVRYQNMGNTSGAVGSWRALHPNGNTFFFGETPESREWTDTGLEEVLHGRWMLTRVVDPLGNEIVYTWEKVIGYGLNGTQQSNVDVVLTAIEYGGNTTANPDLPMHARIELNWGASNPCLNSFVPVGAEFTYRNGIRTYRGARRLQFIRVRSRSSATAGFTVRHHIDLVYDQSAESCTQPRGPVRVLAEIGQTTWDSSGGSQQTLPTIKFGYGGTPERTLSDSGDALPGSLSIAPTHLEWGRRHFDPRDGGSWPSLRSEVVDLDGDGFIDVIESSSAAEDSCGTTAYLNASDGIGGHFGSAVAIARPQLPWENGATPNLVDRKEGCSLGYQMNRRTFLPTDPEQQCGSMAANYNAFRLFDVTGDSIPELLSSFDYKPGKYNPLLDQAAMYPQGTPTCDTTVAPCLHSTAGRVMCTANHDPIIPTAEDDPYENPGGACGCAQGTCGASSCMIPEWGGVTCPTFPCNPDECTVAACDRGNVDLVANLFQRSEQSEDGARAWPGDAYSPGTVGWEGASGVRQGMNQFCRYQAENACNQHVWRSSTFDRVNRNYAAPLLRTVPTPLESARATARMGSGGVVGSFHGLIDIDGDRCPDSIYLPPPHRDSLWSGGLQVFRGNCAGEFRGKPDGQGGEVPYLWPTPSDVSRVIAYSYATSSPKAGPTEQRRTVHEEAALLDINGDGLPDYVRAGQSGAAAQVYFNNGAGFEGLPTRLADAGSPALIGTLNREETVVLSHDNRGTSHIANGWSVNTVRTHDLDVDGLVDVVRLGSPDAPPTFDPWQQTDKTVRLHVNVGDYFLAPVSSTTTDKWWTGLARITVTNGTNWWVKTDVRDLNGDGLPDQFGGGVRTGGCNVSGSPDSASAWVTCATQGGIERDASDVTGQGQRLLRSIENGRGARVEFEYGSIAKGPPFIQQANNSRLPTPLWFVVNMKVYPGKLADGTTDAPPMQTAYRYIEPVFNQDPHGQWGFRGFDRVQEFGPPNAAGAHLRTARVYQYSLDYSGRLRAVAVWDDDANRLHSYALTEWERAALFGGDVESFHPIEDRHWECPATGGTPQIELCMANGVFKRTARKFVPVVQGSLSYSGIATSDLPTASGEVVSPGPSTIPILYLLRGERLTTGVVLPEMVV